MANSMYPAAPALPDGSSHDSLMIFLGTSSGLIIVASAALAGRLAPRLFSIASWSVKIIPLAPFVRNGQKMPDYSDETWLLKLTKLTLVGAILWIWAVCFVKVSLLTTLLGLRNGKYWRFFLRALIVAQVLFTVADTSVQVVITKLLRSKACITGQSHVCTPMVRFDAYAQAVFTIGTDIIISLIPLTFVAQLRRPFWEKLLICGLMALGLLVSGASIQKAIVASKLSKLTKSNTVQLASSLNTWTCAEMFGGIIAACMPRLKAVVERFLRRIGFTLPVTTGTKAYKNADDLPDFHLESLNSDAANERSQPEQDEGSRRWANLAKGSDTVTTIQLQQNNKQQC